MHRHSKKILLLQGAVGGFTRYFARDLRKRGYEVRRLVFNGGDLLFALGGPYEVVRSRNGDFGPVFERIFSEWRPDHVFGFGDERPIHRLAASIADRFGVPFWFFEEGYIRPNHVTMERYGNNANSRLPVSFDPNSDPGSPIPVPQLSGQSQWLAWLAMWYFIAHRVSMPFFRGYVHHRDRKLVSEFRFYWRGWFRRLMSARHDFDLVSRLCAPHPPRFFLLALQVHDDLQLLRHGRGWRVKHFLDMVLESFERAAPPDTLLVVKSHPLDVGYGHHGNHLRKIVESRSLSGRLFYLTDGPAAPLVRRAVGLVTINSTMGMTAVGECVPCIAFGDTFYSLPGLATSGTSTSDLDRFWHDPPPIDRDVSRRFLKHIHADALLPGSFYLSRSWPSLVAAVIERLTVHDAG